MDRARRKEVQVRVILGFVLALVAASATAQPQINPAAVHVVASPNVLGWPVTTRITSVDVAADGMGIAFDRCGAWPAVTPPGWTGPLTYTLWLFLDIGGEWYGSGIIQFWACDQHNGGPIYLENQIARNWVYGTQWSPMTGHQPAPGERIAFMVSAGNARMQDDHLVAERSAIVEVAMPSGPGLLPFLAVEGTPPNPPPPVVTPPPPAPPPVVVPPVVVPPAPLPTLDLSGVYAQLAALGAKVDAVDRNVTDGRAENKTFFEGVKSVWRQIGEPLLKYVAPAVAAYFAGKKL